MSHPTHTLLPALPALPALPPSHPRSLRVSPLSHSVPPSQPTKAFPPPPMTTPDPSLSHNYNNHIYPTSTSPPPANPPNPSADRPATLHAPAHTFQVPSLTVTSPGDADTPQSSTLPPSIDDDNMAKGSPPLIDPRYCCCGMCFSRPSATRTQELTSSGADGQCGHLLDHCRADGAHADELADPRLWRSRRPCCALPRRVVSVCARPELAFRVWPGSTTRDALATPVHRFTRAVPLTRSARRRNTNLCDVHPRDRVPRRAGRAARGLCGRLSRAFAPSRPAARTLTCRRRPRRSGSTAR